MNKRITSLALVFVMVLSLLVTAVPALAAPIESTQLKVTADKTSAKPGDTITYTITMGPVSDMGSMQMCLDIPTGLTYVENSTELADGLKATLGFDDVAWTEISKMINGVASAADYESNTDTVIAKFQCTVDADFSGTAEVGLTNLEFGSCQTFEYHTDRFSVVKASVTVTVPHSHVYDQEVATAEHLKTPATCTSPAVYYKSCTCGENGTETFEYGGLGAHNWTPATCTVPKTCSVCQATEGDPLGHTEGNEWKYDSDNHWHTCTVEGCGVVIESSKEAHTPDRAEATVNDPIKCSVCGYEIEAQLVAVTNIAATITAPVLGATPDYTPTYVSTPSGGVQFGEVTWYKIKKEDYTGTYEDNWTEMASDETFTTEYYYSADMFFRPEDGYGISEDVTGTVNGKAHVDTYGSVYGEDPNGGDYAYLCIEFGPLHDADTEHFESDADNHWNNCANCDEKQNIAPHAFEWIIDKEATATEKGSKHEECTVCGYAKASVDIPATGTEKTENPDTGDANNMLLWGALLLAGGLGVTGTAAYSKKRREDAE